MKRNLYLVFLFSFLFLLLLTTSSHALFNSDVKKAREFMKAGMYPQAISLLEKRVNEKPTDEEAHYELGVCYINTGNFRGADQRFASAVKLKPDYGYKIGGEYQKAGNKKLNNRQIQSAINLFDKAAKYQPNLKKEIAQKCFEKGSVILKSISQNKHSGNSETTAYRCFVTAHKLDLATGKKTGIGDDISDLYYNTCMQTDKPCINFLKRSYEFSKKNLPKIVEFIKSLHSAAVNDIQKDEIRDYLLHFYSPKERDEAIPPDYETVNPGQIKVVVLRDGKKPIKYLRLPSTGYPFKIGRSRDQTNFCIKTRTGLVIPFSKIRTSNIFLDHRDFMIIPTDKNKVKIGIKVQ